MRHNLRHIKSRVPKSPLFETVEGKIWFFECHLILKIHYHLLLKITPDNPNLISYWKKRRTSQGKSHWSLGSKLYRVAQNQGWCCPICGEHLFNGEELHTHHVIRVADGGTDREENLIHLHKICHQHSHMSKYSALQKA